MDLGGAQLGRSGSHRGAVRWWLGWSMWVRAGHFLPLHVVSLPGLLWAFSQHGGSGLQLECSTT